MTPTSFGLRVGSLSAGHTQAHLIYNCINLTQVVSLFPSNLLSLFTKIRGKLQKLPS